MRQETFEARYRDLWDEYNAILIQLEKKKPGIILNVNITDFPRLYRKVCNHYAMALTRQYSPALVTRLHSMVMAGHKRIYKQTSFRFSAVTGFFSRTFPETFRQNILFFITALLMFLIPFIGIGTSCYFKQDVIYSVMSESQISDFEYMYDPANKKTGRTEEQYSDKDVVMFGYYIKNNISIGFRTFAGGILAGAGTVFFLVFNGIILGAVSGHVTRMGFNETFWPFVSGHGAFELTAIIISGMAGLVLARAVIAPGNLKRIDALKHSARTALTLILGAAAMLLVAAFIEAFWSSSDTPPAIKYSVAGVLWLSVILYLSAAGRRSGTQRILINRQRRSGGVN